MVHQLPDRRECLFGRDGDLAGLIGRVQFKGLTAVVARPAMGKSWLLTELARRLATEHEPRYLVGFARSSGQTPDLLLRAVVDLYGRWLSDADYRQQAKTVWKQQKSHVLPGVAKAVAKIFKEIGGSVAKPVTAVVEDAINGLVAANRTLTTGGIQLPTLQYDQARDLLAMVAQTAEPPIALFLDQWEKSPDPKFEAKTLEGFLHNLDEWPKCHIFMALRAETPAIGTVEKLVASLPGPAEIRPLELMTLEKADSRARLADYVRQSIPAAAGAEDEAILRLIDGYPGVLYQWTSDYQKANMQTLPNLKDVAADAQNYRFRELEDLLPALEGDRRRVAIRLALLPLSASEAWAALKPALLGGLAEPLLDELRLAKVLEKADPPSFGHAKRAEAVREWFMKNLPLFMRAEAEPVILGLAAPIRQLDPGIYVNIAALRSLLPTARELNLSAKSMVVCQAAATLFGDHGSVDDALVQGARHAEAATAPLVAMGLFNTLGLFNILAYTTAEANLERRDALLDELRRLATAHPEDAAVRELLAISLVNTLIHAKAEANLKPHDALLTELRDLSIAHPEDAAVRELLAISLVNTLIHPKAEANLERRDALLGELRDLSIAHPEDAAVRKSLAEGLVITLIHAKAEANLERRDALLGELRCLAATHPEDAAVRKSLAIGLFNTLNNAKAEEDLERRDALLGELRALAAAHPEDAAVRQLLAMGPADL